MIREFKQSLTQEMTKILEKLNNGYNIDFTGIVDKIYYINSVVFNGVESLITNPVAEEVCTPLPPPIIGPVVPPGPVITPPIVVTTIPVATSNTTITSGGTIMSEGNSVVTHKGVCWIENTSPSLVPTINDSYTDEGTGAATFVSYPSYLVANTSYHVRAYATNSAGTSYGTKYTVSTLITAALPILTTTAATVTSSTISTGGNISSTGSSPVISRGVCISTSTTPTTSDLKTSNGNGIGAFTSDFTGLSVGTLYYLRAYAINSVGTAYGDLITITTSAISATITTTVASSITGTTTTSGGNISMDGGSAVTSRGVCWSTSINPTTSNTKTINGSGIGIFTSDLTSLTPGVLYYIRAYAINSQGTSYGNQVSFTSTVNVPILTTTTATGITLTTANSGGNITNSGGGSITERGVCFNTTGGPTKTSSKVTSGTGTGVYTILLSPLTENTLYYARAYATNSGGTGYGNEITFTTLPILATLTTTAVTGITSTTANTGGTITYAGTGIISERGVCYDIYPSPVISGLHIVGSVTSPFTINLTSLTSDTPYYVRAYVIYNGTPIYGQEVAFVTSTAGIVPVVPTPNVVVIDNKGITTISVSANSVLATGGATVDEVGFVIKAGSAPTIADGKVQIASYNTNTTYTFTGLTSSTIYYIKAYAHNSAGYGLGATTTQITNSSVILDIPVLTMSLVSTTTTEIKVRGTIINSGNATITAVSFGRKTSTGVTITDNPISSTLIGNIFEATYYSLTPATDYYFKAYATNSVGTGESFEPIYTTSPALLNPAVITNTSYTADVNTLGVSLIISGGDPSAVINTQGFYWSLAPFTEADFSNPAVYNHLSPGITAYTITGLTLNTTYYVRAAADVQSPYADIVVGNQVTMTTLASAPVIPTNTLKSVFVAGLDTRLAYEIWLSNTTGSTIYYRLRMKNITNGGDWYVGPQIIVIAGTTNSLRSGYVASMGFSNYDGDMVDVSLSNTDGSTWDAAFVVSPAPPFLIPYSA